MWMYIQSAVVDGKLVSEKKTAAEKMLFNPGKLRKYYIAGGKNSQESQNEDICQI